MFKSNPNQPWTAKLQNAWQNPFTQIGLGLLATNGSNYGEHTIGRGIMTGMNNWDAIKQQGIERQRAEEDRERQMVMQGREDITWDRQTAEYDRQEKQRAYYDQLRQQNPAWAYYTDAQIDMIIQEQLKSKYKTYDYGKSPIYGYDSKNNLVIGYSDGRGNTRWENAIGEVRPAKPYTYNDIGGQITSTPWAQPIGGFPAMGGAPQVPQTQIPFMPNAQPQSPSVSGVIQKTLPPQENPQHIADKASAKAVAESQATANIDWYGVQSNANSLLDKIEEFENSDLEGIYGFQGNFPSLPWSDAAEAERRRDQLQGETFLQAYERLKGGGQITEIEGQKAEQAYARLQAAQSVESAKKSLKDFKKEIVRLTNIAARKSGVKGRVFSRQKADERRQSSLKRYVK